jgi:hypothetical protein
MPWEILLHWGDNAIQVVQQARPEVLGDYNQNGKVDAADYVVWRKLLGPGALPNEGGVSNNLVDEADYQFWRSRFGATAETPPGVGSMVSSVPDPSTCALLLLGVLPTLISHRRRRSHSAH